MKKKQKKQSNELKNWSIVAGIWLVALVLAYASCSVRALSQKSPRASKVIIEKAQPEGSIQLTTGNTVNFRGEFNDNTVSKVQQKLKKLVQFRGKKSYPIYIVFNSPGGSVDAGMSLISFVNSLENVHTITIFGASMSAMSMQLINGKRYVTEDTTLMFHRAKIGGIGGQIEVGEVESRVAYIKSMLRSIGKRVAKRIGLSYDQYSARVKDEWWIYGSDAVTEGAADETVKLSCSKALQEQMEESIEQVFIFTTTVKRSACPLLI